MDPLPEVDFCGLRLSRLLIGANPFGGYSHQTAERDAQMRAYYTPDRIVETWRLAEDEGITGMVANNETPRVLQAVVRYHREGGRLQWIAQLNCMHKPDMEVAIDEALAIGAKAVFFHGALIDAAFAEQDESKVRRWFSHAKAKASLLDGSHSGDREAVHRLQGSGSGPNRRATGSRIRLREYQARRRCEPRDVPWRPRRYGHPQRRTRSFHSWLIGLEWRLLALPIPYDAFVLVKDGIVRLGWRWAALRRAQGSVRDLARF
jgi:hypothetical protein